ncbi:MAG: ImmA/IrrE family metallo-endopeptidase [Clostridia bacterium]|nr:ImmA/IrrE family metallo-endopeptidase [Clostridia bacterium]
MTAKSIKKTVSGLLPDPFAAAEALGITVLFLELPDCTKGICYEVQNHKIIILSNTLSKGEARYFCAHELGHAVLHPELNYSFLMSRTLFEPKKFEREADIFAAELLISDDALCSPELKNMSSAQIASLLCLPEKLILLKTNTLEP